MSVPLANTNTHDAMTSSEPLRSKRAVIFIRTRSIPADPNLDEVQLEAQERYCRRVAAKLGADVVREYVTRGGSAESGTREIVEKMLQAALADDVDYVIVERLDRITRRPDEMARIARRLWAAGTSLVTTWKPAGLFRDAEHLGMLTAMFGEGRTQ